MTPGDDLPAPPTRPEARHSAGSAAVGKDGPTFDERIERLVARLRGLPLAEVLPSAAAPAAGGGATGRAVEAVLGAARRQTRQHTKAFKHRAQVEAIAEHCLRRLPSTCEVVVELGAGQGLLGHAVSVASGLPLVAIEQRGNTDALDAAVPQEGEVAGAAVLRVQADIGDESAWPTGLWSESGEAQAVLLAKHLCSHSSDLAVGAAVSLGARLGLLCLAPCCHAKMAWEGLGAEMQDWLRRSGCIEDAKDFSLLLDVVRLSRAGDAKKGYVPCAKWKLRRYLEQDEVEALGRRACRVIDEARLSRLRAAGFDAVLLEYCDAGLTPDNVLILAARGGWLQADAAAPQGWEPGHAHPESGVVLELDPTSPVSLLQRLLAYLHEQRPVRFRAMHSVLPLAECAQSRAPPAVACFAEQGHARELLRQLKECPVLARVATRALPFEEPAQDLEAAAETAGMLLAAEGPGAMVRVQARPRSIEGEVCSAMGPSRLQPARPTHVLSVVSLGLPGAVAGAGANGAGAVAEGSGRQPPLRVSLLPRQELDVAAWGAARAEGDRGARAYWRCVELARRWPQRVGAARSVALWTDSPEPCEWVRRWLDEFSPAGAAAVELRLSGDGVAHQWIRGAPSHGGMAEATVLLCDVADTGDGAVDALRGLLAACAPGGSAGGALAAEGLAVLRLRCGRSARAEKQWHRRASRDLQAKLGASRVELHHLLADRELERTAAFSWSGPPPARAAAAGGAPESAAPREAGTEACE
ncbi:unnamed protein product [Prorocentrum cordatum]|uniref:tRNA:m(4)X modification enzyme TRM13 n=1 Tax=Prorocentrum cordatum TaxID=2364126 RepID=A0ABN9XPP2_9DINO|nr:unnamed protein product [Polarella glacialis]